MRQYKVPLYIAGTSLLAVSSFVTAADDPVLEIGKAYRTDVTIFVKDGPQGNGLPAGRNSKFRVLDRQTNQYTIQFESIYQYRNPLAGQPCPNFLNPSNVVPPGANVAPPAANAVPPRAKEDWCRTTLNKDQLYILEKQMSGGAPVTSIVREGTAGFTSGPFIVPFKWRESDDSLHAGGNLGMYIGHEFGIPDIAGLREIGWLARAPIVITPIISFGATVVNFGKEQSFSGNTEGKSKAGAYWAAGFMLKKWGNANIGVTYGRDYIGDDDWIHEGRGWWAFSVNWDLTAK